MLDLPATRFNLLQLRQLVLNVELDVCWPADYPLDADLLLGWAVEVFGEREIVLLLLGSRRCDRCVRACRGVCCHGVMLGHRVSGNVLILHTASVSRHRFIGHWVLLNWSVFESDVSVAILVFTQLWLEPILLDLFPVDEVAGVNFIDEVSGWVARWSIKLTAQLHVGTKPVRVVKLLPFGHLL